MHSASINIEKYDFEVVKKFAIMSLIWGIFAMGIGVIIAFQLYFPALNLDLPYFSFGRLRPIHTNIVIFGFGGCALFATAYYIVQRTCQVPLINKSLAHFTFWGWQLILILGTITLALGYTTSHEYAEFIWPIDIIMAVVWVSFCVVFIGTVFKRNTPYIYIANWYYMALLIGVTILHIINSMQIPISWTESIYIYPGVVDAMIQWWYGHNAVGFVLTAGFLGMMYYFLPKQANTPIYSYHLSIISFWSLIAIYMWAGAHHLQFTALPDWIQGIGVVMSIILLFPSWGSTINGIMTISEVWYKIKTDPIIRFLIVAVSFYGMSTFEGPLMSIKTVNALSHYTDWTIGHVHSGALGWVAMITFASFYHLFPKLYNTKIFSTNLIFTHFWLATIGIVLYITSMWFNGVMQGLMWQASNIDGSLTYSFLDGVVASKLGYLVRAIGGSFFLLGIILMAYNIFMTIYVQVSKEKTITINSSKSLTKKTI